MLKKGYNTVIIDSKLVEKEFEESEGPAHEKVMYTCILLVTNNRICVKFA